MVATFKTNIAASIMIYGIKASMKSRQTNRILFGESAISQLFCQGFITEHVP